MHLGNMARTSASAFNLGRNNVAQMNGQNAQNALNAQHALNAQMMPWSSFMALGNVGEFSLKSEKADVATVSLRSLRQADPANVKATAETLKNHGFAWLDFADDGLNGSESRTTLAEIGDFLAKNEHCGHPHAMEGHFSAAHKDGIRMVTGSWMSRNESKLPRKLQEKLVCLASDLDAAQQEVVKAIEPALSLTNEVGKLLDIPLLSPESPAGLEQYGLLDIVRYRGGDGPEEVVASHADPGLLILSLPCSTPGLQLKDALGSWRTPPPGHGVLWAGEAGKRLGLAPGIHRVVAAGTAPNHSPRLSAWHELCSRSQLCPPMLQVLEQQNLQLKMGETTGTAEVLKLLQASEDHHNVQLVERRGVPVGKSGVVVRDIYVPWNGQASFRGSRHGYPSRGSRVSKAPRPDLTLAAGQVEIVPLHPVPDEPMWGCEGLLWASLSSLLAQSRAFADQWCQSYEPFQCWPSCTLMLARAWASLQFRTCLGLVRMSACLGNVQTAWKALRQNQHFADLSFRHVMILCDSDSN